MILTSLFVLAAYQQAPPLASPLPTRAQPLVISGVWKQTTPVPALQKPSQESAATLRNHPWMRFTPQHQWPIDVPPGGRVKVQLACKQNSFWVRFVSDAKERDTGFLTNLIMGRRDAQFYQNRSSETRRIWCIMGPTRESVDKESYELKFTDF